MCVCLCQVQEEAALVKENLDMNYSSVDYCFLNQNDQGKTVLSFLNPDSGEGMWWVGVGV